MVESLSIFSTPEAWISLATLAALEIVLGIDNIVFISILSGRLPVEQRDKAMRLGLAVALLSRLALLATISWVMRLERELFAVFGHAFSGKDLILLGGGLFLIAKATYEIYDKVEAADPGVWDEDPETKGASRMGMIIVQIMLLDIVFSLDSVITAVGMVDHLVIMVIAVIVAVAIMLIFAAQIGRFVDRHPSIKILALAFLVMIGVILAAEGTGHHFPKGYVYFAMAFSLGIELINMRYRRAQGKLEKTVSPLGD